MSNTLYWKLAMQSDGKLLYLFTSTWESAVRLDLETSSEKSLIADARSQRQMSENPKTFVRTDTPSEADHRDLATAAGDAAAKTFSTTRRVLSVERIEAIPNLHKPVEIFVRSERLCLSVLRDINAEQGAAATP